VEAAMPDTAFRIAMLNRISLAPYYDPTAINFTGYEWLIVERAGNVVTISDGNIPAAGTETVAPDGLMANNTLVGLLIDPGQADDTFLFMRHLAPPTATEGHFFPADGFVRISHADGNPRGLGAHGRHALISETRSGRMELIDIAIPPATFDGARTWHFAAVQKPWSKQTL
jgi:hypothetical protein